MLNRKIILGTLLIGIGIFLCVDSSMLYYYYNYTDINFYFMHPTYELVARFVIGALFILNGILFLLKNKYTELFLKKVSWGLIGYGLLRFILNFEFWTEEIFGGFIYILSGLVFMVLVKKPNLDTLKE